MKKTELHAIRTDYQKGGLDLSDCPAYPNVLFESWLEQAISSECSEPTAMVLSTLGKDLRLASRVVLLKELTDAGFHFFTNYESRKGQELGTHPQASILFFWPQLERQVRVEGRVEKIPELRSDRYFESRPVDSRINAIISPQSQVIPDRQELIRRKALFERELAAGKAQLSRPESWGGYVLIPDYFEFWQGRPGRLHDRISYSLKEERWQTQCLAP